MKKLNPFAKFLKNFFPNAPRKLIMSFDDVYFFRFSGKLCISLFGRIRHLVGARL